MRELELLVANFEMSSPGTSSLHLERKRDEDKVMSPAAILDIVKHTLKLYKQKVEETTTEVQIN